LFALSVHYAKSVGADIILHTDSAGEKIFGVLPYDNIHITLDKLDLHCRFWAAGKMVAHENSPLGYIHIDGDVFIKTTQALEAITLKNEDVVFQSREYICFDSKYESTFYKYNLDLLRRHVDNDTMRLIKQYESRDNAYNTGVFGFGNENLKREFLGGYWDTANKLCRNQSFIDEVNAYQDTCPDIILEQMHLYCLCRKHNAKTKSVFQEHDNIFEKAKEIGYTHIIGKEKYSHIDEVKARLRELNPQLYSKVSDHIKTI
jgi:hypothetical protein